MPSVSPVLATVTVCVPSIPSSCLSMGEFPERRQLNPKKQQWLSVLIDTPGDIPPESAEMSFSAQPGILEVCRLVSKMEINYDSF